LILRVLGRRIKMGRERAAAFAVCEEREVREEVREEARSGLGGQS
jgi:hypothetical protein